MLLDIMIDELGFVAVLIVCVCSGVLFASRLLNSGAEYSERQPNGLPVYHPPFEAPIYRGPFDTPIYLNQLNSKKMVKLQVIGHLGRDAVINNVGGKSVINFSVAHSTKYKNSEGQDVNYTFWVECAYWTDRLKIADYLKQGTQVFAEGVPSVDTYKNKDGIQVAKQRLKVYDIQLLGSKQERDSSPAAVSSQPEPLHGDDDLSF